MRRKAKPHHALRSVSLVIQPWGHQGHGKCLIALSSWSSFGKNVFHGGPWLQPPNLADVTYGLWLMAPLALTSS